MNKSEKDAGTKTTNKFQNYESPIFVVLILKDKGDIKYIQE